MKKELEEILKSLKEAEKEFEQKLKNYDLNNIIKKEEKND